MLTLADEPAQWEHTKAEAMVAALRTAAGKIPGSRFVALGTRPADTRALVRQDAGRRHGVQRNAMRQHPGRSPVPARRSWKKANPIACGILCPILEAAIRDEARQARFDPALLAAFQIPTA